MDEPDYSKRDYLLPAGCKDLIDVLKLKQQKEDAQPRGAGEPLGANQPGPFIWKSTKWPITGEVVISEPISVQALAVLLGKRPFRLIADLMEFNIFANVNQNL